MDDFKEFQGKSLDEAIRGACVFYDLPREKLEIELVQDAKSGIFGLVGARKAIIRARRAPTRSGVGSLFGRAGAPESGQGRSGGRFAPRGSDRENAPSRPGRDAFRRERWDKTRPEPGDRQERPEYPARREETRRNEGGEIAETCPARPAARPERMRTERPAAPGRFAPFDAGQEDGDDGLWDSPGGRDAFFPGSHFAPPLSELDQTALENSVRDVAGRMVTAILGEIPIRVSILEHRVDVRVECGEDSGLLIGREGQTLSALQYLASRLVSRIMNAPVRVRFDVGDYRERQDERLRDLALTLAERVRLTGRPCSTRPMSSYHRRLVHMALQDAPDIITRSSGDGALKRIIIQRRRTDRSDRAEGADDAGRFPRADRGRQDRFR